MQEIIFEEKGNNVVNDLTLPKVIVERLIEKNLTLASAESCTGGLFAKEVTEISGASAVFDRSIVTYSNNAKIEELGVKEETLLNFGAVSMQTAYEMACGIKNVSNTDIGISVTGIAGPTGATKDKPVGLVYVGIATDTGVKVRELRLLGDRAENRKNSMLNMFDMINEFLNK